MAWLVYLRCSASATVFPPLIKSSTYKLFRISATSSGYVCSMFSRCRSSTPPNRNGDDDRPNRALVNRKVSTVLVVKSFSQWNLIASLSNSRIRTCKKACFKSPAKATGWNRLRTRTLQSWFCNGGPVSKHSLRDGDLWFGRAEASQTIRIFELCASSRVTALCGM